MPDLTVDRSDLRHLVESYAIGCDRRDLELLASCFTDGGVLTVHRPDRPTSALTAPAELDRIPAGLGRYDHTFHLVGNHRVEVADDDATGDTYCVAHHVSGDVDHVMHIRYEDRYRRTADGWRIATRDVHVLWTSTEALTS